MSKDRDLEEARSEAEVILSLEESRVAALFFAGTMKRNLSRTIRHLDKLVANGGADEALGKRALSRLGFSSQK